MLISSSDDKTIRLWDIHTSTCTTVLEVRTTISLHATAW